MFGHNNSTISGFVAVCFLLRISIVNFILISVDRGCLNPWGLFGCYVDGARVQTCGRALFCLCCGETSEATVDRVRVQLGRNT